MKRRGLQLNRKHRLALYGDSALLFISGAAWAWVNCRDESGGVSESLRHLKPWLLKVHGYSAMVFVLLLGTLLPIHAHRAWRVRKNRGNGLRFLVAISLITLSGYALYYTGDEAWRQFISRLHLWPGIAAPALLVWHIRQGRKSIKPG